MDLEIRPKPTAEERRAIVQALAPVLDGRSVPPPLRSRWRARGVRESTADGAPELFGRGYATARPRRSRGATRA